MTGACDAKTMATGRLRCRRSPGSSLAGKVGWLLCIDELGHMELDRRGAQLLFQVLTEREG